MPKVRVYVPFSGHVAYVVEVCDPEDIEEIKKELDKMSPDDWEDDPDFYETLGDNWGYFDDITEVEELYDCPDCKGSGIVADGDKYGGECCISCRGRGYIDEYTLKSIKEIEERKVSEIQKAEEVAQ